MIESSASTPGGGSLDEHTIFPIPERDRTSTPIQQFWIWGGANVAPINWILGALGIVMGLGLWTTMAVIVVGNVVGMAVFGCFVLMGQRTGVNAMVLSRSAFGRRGAYIPASIEMLVMVGWVAINTWIILDVVLAIFDKIGLGTGNFTKIAVVITVMAVQVGLGTYGFYAISLFEKWTVPVTFALLLVMTILAWTSSSIDWSYAGEATGAARITAMSQLMTAIGIGWGISWLAHASDFSRFVSRDIPQRKLYIAAVAGQFLPVVWLGLLGASIATTGTGADPALMIVGTFGAMALPVLLLILHAPIAANILNIYSASLAALTLDVKIARWKICMGLGILAALAAIFLIFETSLANAISAWLSGLVIWLSAWATIMMLHYYVARRQHIDIEALYQSPKESRVGDFNGRALGCFGLGIVAGWLFEYGQTPVFQGPIASALNQVDFSWLAAIIVTGISYYYIEVRNTRLSDEDVRRLELQTDGLTDVETESVSG